VFRAVVAGVVVLVSSVVVLAGCSGGMSASGPSAACPLLAQLGQTGQTVARADVSDPEAFERTLSDAIAKYVHTARKLRDAVPAGLRADVSRMIAAAERRRFSDADDARARIDRYAQSVCKAGGTAQ
jgi:hypothetical protein